MNYIICENCFGEVPEVFETEDGHYHCGDCKENPNHPFTHKDEDEVGDNLGDLDPIRELAREAHFGIQALLGGSIPAMKVKGHIGKSVYTQSHDRPTDHGLMEFVLNQIVGERRKQDAKWGQQNHAPVWWLSIATEELGEVAQAINKMEWESDAEEKAKWLNCIKDEFVQLAAVCEAAIECLIRHNGTLLASEIVDGVVRIDY